MTARLPPSVKIPSVALKPVLVSSPVDFAAVGFYFTDVSATLILIFPLVSSSSSPPPPIDVLLRSQTAWPSLRG